MPHYDIYNKCYLGAFFVFAVVETLLCSGITYGWASIVVVFKLEHFYLSLCKPFYAEYNLTFPDNINITNHERIVAHGVEQIGGKLPGCPAQDSMFNLIFTISIFCLSGIKFPTGVFIDKCGPRIARSVGGYVNSFVLLDFLIICCFLYNLI